MTYTRSGSDIERGGPTDDLGDATGWVGWITFAGAIMLLLGAFHAIQGLVALFRDDYFVVADSGLLVTVDYTAWGWSHLVWGALVIAAGAGLLAGQMWARVVTVVLALGSALINLAFLPAYPVWSVMMIALDVIIIWAVTVHGREMKGLL